SCSHSAASRPATRPTGAAASAYGWPLSAQPAIPESRWPSKTSRATPSTAAERSSSARRRLVAPQRAQHRAELARGRGDQDDPGAAAGEPVHGGGGEDGLVVGVGVQDDDGTAGQ